MYSLEHVTVVYPSQVVALDSVSVSFPKGSWSVITGPSGSGKSTLLSLLRGDLPPTSGRVTLEGVDLYSLSGDVAGSYRRGIGSVYQEPHFIGHLTCAENVALVLEHADRPLEDIETDVPYVLDLMGIIQYRDRYPHELSGGERQRLQLARAFVHQPDVLLVDEPTSHLDSANAEKVISLLKTLHGMGTTIIATAHHKQQYQSVATEIITLSHGSLVV
jgi:ABC-type ATPase involved in cell division